MSSSASAVPVAPWAITGAGLLFGFSLSAPGQIMPAITTMVLDGVFDRVPDLKVLCVEAGCGWAAYLMDRLDEKQAHFASIMSPLKEKPSDYLRKNVWFVAEPNERTIDMQLDLVGQDRILWGSDFPHIDSHPDAIDHIHRAVTGLRPEQRTAVLGANAARVFGL
jgi:predicted TIM-barrel fold metal-dependent hydrolase